MYKAYFGFREKPFKLVPNPEYLFLSKSHEIALAHLTYAADQGEGFVVITGEVGTGKTTLCRNFLEGLNEQTESAYIFNPNLEYEQLLGAICHEFGIPTPETGAKALLELLYTYLIKKNASDKKVVLVIDEAQSLSIENLELVRMLSNLETTRSKLLQIVLVGQPELESKLESHELRQLAQRISLSYVLAPLSPKDTQAYIRHRLGIASQQRQSDLFTADASRLAYRFSGGIPRLINIVCDRALLTAYSQNRAKITGRVMQTAIAELTERGRVRPSKKRWPLFLGAGICLLALMVAATTLITRTDFFRAFVLAEPELPGREADVQPSGGEKSYKVPDDRRPAVQAEQPRVVPYPISPEKPLVESPPAAMPEPAPQEIQPSSSEAISVRPVPSSNTAASVPTDRPAIAQIIDRLEAMPSRIASATRLLAIWHQPRPNVDLIPAEVDDAGFFEIAARQYGLRSYTVHNDAPLVRRLDLPAVVAMKSAGSSQPVYLVLVGRRGQTFIFEDGLSDTTIEADMDTVQPYMEGPVYIFWKNVLGYDMIIGFGADAKAILEVKNLLRKIGYDQLDQSSAFDPATRQAVMSFQARNRIKIDGLVGPLTKIMLLQEAGAADMPNLSGQGSPPS